MDITFYDAAGKITGSGRFKDDLADMICNAPGTHPHVVGDFLAQAATKYVVAGAVVDRPANPAVLTGAVLSDLPIPCKIQINAASYDCAEATATLAFDHPGTYSIRVVAFPHVDAEFTYVNPA